MATSKHCSICKTGPGTCICTGCQTTFCRKHFSDHHTTLRKELNILVEDHSYLQDQMNKAEDRHGSCSSILLQIDEWQSATIKKVTAIADQARQQVVELLSFKLVEIRTRFRQLSDELGCFREGEDLVEQDLTRLKAKIRTLTQDLEPISKTPSIKLHIERTDEIPWNPLIHAEDKSNNIGKQHSQQLVTASPRAAIIGDNARWTESGVIMAGGNGKGSGLNQLNIPFGLYVDYDQTVYIADYANHRIVTWKCGANSGNVVAGGNGPGEKANQLNQPKDVILDKGGDWLIISDYKNRRVVRWPRSGGNSGETIISDVDCTCLTMDDNGFLYVGDYKKNEVRRWQVGDAHGKLVAGGNKEGNRLDQLSCPTYVFVDRVHSVYVSDTGNHRVMKWVKGANEGIIVAGHGGPGSAHTQLLCPCGIVVDQLGTVYVADCNNHRIMAWLKEDTRGSVLIGGNGAGDQTNQLRCPDGLSLDRHGNIYVSNFGNDRVLKFSIYSEEKPKSNQMVSSSFEQRSTTLSTGGFSAMKPSTPISQVYQKKSRSRRRKKKSHVAKPDNDIETAELLGKLTANNDQCIKKTLKKALTTPSDYSRWDNINASSDEETRTPRHSKISEFSNATENISKLKIEDSSNSSQIILGTNFLCEKDAQEDGSFFRRKEIPSSHGVFQYGVISPISELIGIPLLIYRYKRYSWYGTDEDFGTNNQRITYLMIDNRSGFVEPLGEWDQSVGTALVVRRDKQPFNELHAEVIFHYFKFLLSEFDFQSGSEVYNWMNRSGFAKFLAEWNLSSEISVTLSDFYFEKPMVPLKNSNRITDDGLPKQREGDQQSTASSSKTNPDFGARTGPVPPSGRGIGWDDLYPHPSGGRTVLPPAEFNRFRDLIRHSIFRDVLSDDDN